MSLRPKNMGVSVRARLTQRARGRRENAQLLMTRYGIERLLYRLSRSPHRDAFVLKGAMLFSVWAEQPYRATGDLDLLGIGDNAPEHLAEVFREILATPIEDDGLRFDPGSLRAALARPEDEYAGVRLDFIAELAGARLPIHIDIGYGDAVTPAAVEIDYPALLDQPRPRLKAYPPETVVAEKLQAMVSLDLINSRMKDFYDLWVIAGMFSFDGAILAEAIWRTFERRRTPLPIETPLALTPRFASAKGDQWAAFLGRTEIALAPDSFPEVQARIEALVVPVVRGLLGGGGFQGEWGPGGPWNIPFA